jgi:hypothetical protein
MKQKIRKYILLPIFLLLTGSWAFVFAATFNSLYPVSSVGFPAQEPAWEKSGGVFHNGFSHLFQSCGTWSILMWFNSWNYVPSCITLDEVKEILRISASSTSSINLCADTGALVGFGTGGEIICEEMK